MRDRTFASRCPRGLLDVPARRLSLTRRRHRAPPVRPPLRIGSRFSAFPYPPPPRFSPPPWTLLTVAHARRSASPSGTPCSSYPSSMCSAWRFCLSVYLTLLPRGMEDLRAILDANVMPTSDIPQ